MLLLWVVSLSSVVAQNGTLTGVISDKSNGETLAGANIILEGAKNLTGTTADVNGKYSLSVPAGDVTISVKFVGYVPVTKTIKVSANQTVTLNVSLEADIAMLEELVVVGYGIQQKSVVTGSIAKVEAADIQKSAPLRIEQVLQGKAAGVMVTSNSGQPGDGLTVRVRGTGTINNADPLYVVDGMPTGGIDFLNPNDILSLEVLKDAASTAIYGSRGANGVILVTTKSGPKEGFKITYDGYTGIQNAWRKVGLLDANKYALITNEAYANDGRALPFTNEFISSLGKGTDWQDAILHENAPITEHNVSVAGGGARTSVLSSFSYLNQDGIFAKGKSNYERYTFRLNTTTDLGRFKFGNSLAYTHKETKGIGTNDIFGGILTRAMNIDPITPVLNEDGTYAISPYMSQEIVNPVAATSIINGRYRENKFVSNIWGELEFFKGLKLRSSFGTDLSMAFSDNFTPIYNLGGNVTNAVTKVSKNFNQYFNWQTEHYLSYNTKISNHNITGLVGFSALRDHYEGLYGERQGLKFPDWDYTVIDAATDVENDKAGGGSWEHSMVSYFGRLNYNYNQKYMLESVLRMDGSSNFGPNNRFGLFPSVSAGWVLSKEEFLVNNPVISFMKLRAGWGQNGNERIDMYQYSSKISAIATYVLGGTETLFDGRIPLNASNPDIKWETSEQMNVATDITMFNNRLSLTVDYYVKKTKDWLVQAPIPSYVGLNPAFVNGGDVKNSGLEVEIGYKQQIDDLNFNVNLTSAYNKNEVTLISNAEQVIYGGGAGTGMSSINIARVGMPIGYFWGFKTNGIFQNEAEVLAYKGGAGEGTLIQPKAQPGDLKFVDLNEDGKIDDNDRTMIGNPYPDFTLGLNLNANYKAFDFSMFWYTALGQEIFKITRRYDLPNMNYGISILDRWTGEGSTNEHPRVTVDDPNQNYSRVSDFYLEKGDYLRLKDLQIGYTFPMSLVSKANIKSLRVYFAAQNLLTFTNYTGHDPEVGGGSPINFGIDRGFYPQPRVLRIGVNMSL